MKFKIMIMALLLVSAVGIGSAVNRLPATEFVGNISYTDSGSNVQTFDFNAEPANGDIFTSISNAWTAISGKYLHNEYVIGPSSDTFSYFYDAVTDGSDDQVEINSGLSSGSKHIRILPGAYITSAPIYINETGILFEGSAGTVKSVNMTPSIYYTGGYDAIKINGDANRVSGLYIRNSNDCTPSAGTYAVNSSGAWTQLEYIHIYRARNGILLNGLANSVHKCYGGYFSESQIHVTASECSVTECIFGNGVTDSTYGLFIDGVSNFYASDCQFLRGGESLRIWNTHAAFISNSYFDTSTGISRIESSTGRYTRHISISNCWFARYTKHSGTGLRIAAADQNATYSITIDGCTFRSCKTNFIQLIKTYHVIISDTHFVNMIDEETTVCVSINSGYNTIVTGNDYHNGHFTALDPTNNIFGVFRNGGDHLIAIGNDFTECFNGAIVGPNFTHQEVGYNLGP